MFCTEIIAEILFQSRHAWAKRASLGNAVNLQNYILPAEGIDWRGLLKHWTPPLPEDFSLWFVNRFGDIFGAAPDGGILRLDVGSGTCAVAARSREEFARLLDLPANVDGWLRPSVVDACMRANITLSPGECFGFRVPPTLQGTYDVSNLVPTRLDAHYSWLAHITRQDEIYWIEP